MPVPSNLRALRNFACILCALASFAMPLSAQPFTFSSIRPVFLNELEYGEVVLADLDRDGDFDLLATGNSENTPPFVPRTYAALSGEPYFFSAGGEGLVFSERALGQGLWQSSLAITDFDRDGTMDIVVSGRIHNGANFETRPLEGAAYLHRGGASASFTTVPSGFMGVYGGKVSAADIDGDGDEDLLIAGLHRPDEVVATLYFNMNGRYESKTFPFEALAMGDIEWADLDRDGDLDLAFSGVTGTGKFQTKLYRNDGNGTLTEHASNLPGLAYSAMDWGDYDGDGDLDLALSGGLYHGTRYLEPVVQIWRNDSGRLNHSGMELASVMHGDIAWGDYDSDGALDLAVAGRTDLGSGRSGFVYRNENGNLVPRISVPGLAASSTVWGDYDGDNDLDMITAGSSLNTNPLLRMYRNDSPVVNMPPSAPTGLGAGESNGVVTLTWQSGTDRETPAASLSYNLRIGTASGQDNVMVSYSDPSTGRRLLPDRGNAGLHASWKLRNLPAGNYFWSVQAIDQSLVASSWSEEASFSVSGGGKLTSVEDVPLPTTALGGGYPNPFHGAVTVPLTLESNSHVEISVYNALGSLVKRLISTPLAPGTHQVQWAGVDERGMPVAPGLYLVRMKTGSAQHMQPVTLIR